MGNFTKNLSRREFTCDCGCGFDTVDFHLVKWMQETVDGISHATGREVYVVITGGNRCASHNASIGGADNSQHLYGKAADHKLFYKDTDEQVDPEIVARHYEFAHPECGLGRYSNRTHVDSRGYCARWDAR